MKPQSAKAKGRKLQQYVRDRILERFTTLEEDDVKSTGMGQSGEDVQLSPKARAVLPWAIECKNRAKFAIYADYEQAKNHAATKKDCEPVLIIKQNSYRPLAVVDLEYLLYLEGVASES